MTDEQIIRQIEKILQELRPTIQMHEGDIEFVSYDSGIVSLRLHGACVGCPMSFYTLKLGIEERFKEHLPEIQEVIAVD